MKRLTRKVGEANIGGDSCIADMVDGAVVDNEKDWAADAGGKPMEICLECGPRRHRLPTCSETKAEQRLPL